MTGHPTNEGIGAAQSKTGERAWPLNRGIGRSKTMSGESFETKTDEKGRVIFIPAEKGTYLISSKDLMLKADRVKVGE